jgi:hypothetical protein
VQNAEGEFFRAAQEVNMELEKLHAAALYKGPIEKKSQLSASPEPSTKPKPHNLPTATNQHKFFHAYPMKTRDAENRTPKPPTSHL